MHRQANCSSIRYTNTAAPRRRPLPGDGQNLPEGDLFPQPDGSLVRASFEDMASLMGLRVRDVPSDRKHQGSYERVAELLKYLQLPADSLHRFFEQAAFSVMVRNGDTRLKNFGVRYTSETEVRPAPMCDVVTTATCRYTRHESGPELEDRTMALKLFKGKHHSKAYPTRDELIHFGRQVCGVTRPDEALRRMPEGMPLALAGAPGDARLPTPLTQDMSAVWASGLAYADV